MKATQRQLNIISNMVSLGDDSCTRAGMQDLAKRLFPESIGEIDHAIYVHPINDRWGEYCKTAYVDRHKFLLPE